MKQYSKRMVIIHWLTLVLVVGAWFLGEALDEARHGSGATLGSYVTHLLVGDAILLLTLVRLYFRRKDGVPLPVGESLTDKVAKGVHYGLYAVLVLLPVSGIVTVATSDVAKALDAGDAALLPKKFSGVPAHEAHEILVAVLIILVVVHTLGAIWHQFIKKDGLMDRMSFHRKD